VKEASGELSMTAITVVAIAAIAVVFTTLIWPGIKANIQRATYCSQSFNCVCNSQNPGDLCDCWYIPGNNKGDATGNVTPTSIQCPNNSQ